MRYKLLITIELPEDTTEQSEAKTIANTIEWLEEIGFKVEDMEFE